MLGPAEAHEAQLADFLGSLRFSDLPGRVVVAAETVILDHLVCASIGMEQPWIRILEDQLRTEMGAFAPGSSTPFATVYRSPELVPARFATMVNATASHGLELDDLYPAGLLHPGCSVVPAAIATACYANDDGRDLITAVVAGYELIGRLCQAAGNSHSDRGFHGTGVIGPTGAAAAVAKLLDGDATTMRNAVGISASFGGGIKAFQNGPGMVKCLHAGRAAEAGLLAGQLAARGFLGPAGALAGHFGLIDVLAYGATTRPERLSAELGTEYVVNDTYIKQFAACGRIHGAIRAAIDLKDKDNIRVREIKQIIIGGARDMVDQNSIPVPTDSMTAQYSVQYSVALALLGLTHDLSRYQLVEAYTDPAVLELIRRMKVVVDEEAEAKSPESKDARVTVVLGNGERWVRYGSANAASSSGWNAIEKKCEWLWDGGLSMEHQKGLFAAVRRLKEGGSIADCLSFLTQSTPTG